MTPHTYVPLWCKSNGSFLEGASHPEALIDRASQYGLSSMALTDRDGVYGIVRAHVTAKATGVHLIIGAEVTLDDDSTIVLLAQDRGGYANLCRLLTTGRRRRPKGESSVTWQEVCEHAPGLLALWGGDTSLLVRDADTDDVASLLREAFGDRLYGMVARHRRDEECAQELRLRARAAQYGLPLAAAVQVLYHDPERRALQDVMTCIRHGVTIHTAGRRLRPNAGHALMEGRAFAALFHDDPASVARTHDIAARCVFSLDQIRYRYPAEQLPDSMTSSTWLKKLAHEKIRARYGNAVPDRVTAQLDKELALVEELDYGGYFLTMHDIVTFCRAHDILCQGRGSAANSVLCFALGVTSVDPTRIDLLFERFLSRERNEPPDIDLDVMHERREEVIQHMYAKYGRSHAAMVANVVRYQPKSAVRDVGKALGISETTLDRLSKMLSHYQAPHAEALLDAGLDPEAPLSRHLLRLSNEILGAPRHLSIHPGGFLLGHEPVHDIVPIENATMADRTVIQWDKDDVEAIGLFKVDILGLGALTQLDLCFKLLNAHRGIEMSMATIPEGDAPTYAMICRGDTVGVFQIESRAQMSMLPRLRPKDYYDLVIQISIVRPGPIAGGMVHPYLRRRNGEPFVYPHESLVPVLEKTKGVPLFQEQVMRIAMVAADYTPGEADQLRRDMAAWKRSSRLEGHRERLITRMTAKGITREFAERVFQQIRGFGEYGFPESHAASFALISYASSYLRCHYPAEFTCGLLNALPMGFYSAATIVEDAKRLGVEVRPVDVQHSRWECTLEPAIETANGTRPFAVRMGLRFVKHVNETRGKHLVESRMAKNPGGTEQPGFSPAVIGRPFTSLSDLAQRSGLTERALSTLAQAGAFEALTRSRRAALWEVPGAARDRRLSLPFEASDGDNDAPAFTPLGDGAVVAWDYQASSHSTRGHPMAALRPRLASRGVLSAADIRGRASGASVRHAGLVICRQRPPTASNVTFVTLEDETGFVNLVVWEPVFEQFAVLVRTAHWLGVTGAVQSQDGVVHVIARALWIPEGLEEPESLVSRDFH